jgi:hypothetical protein
MPSSGIYKPSAYLTVDTLRLRYIAQPVNVMQDLRFSRRWLWRMPSSGMLRCVAFVRTYVLEKRSDRSVRRMLVTANVNSSLILVILMMEALQTYNCVFFSGDHNPLLVCIHNTAIYWLLRQPHTRTSSRGIETVHCHLAATVRTSTIIRFSLCHLCDGYWNATEIQLYKVAHVKPQIFQK